MGCGCGKNKPRSTPSRSGLISNQRSRQVPPIQSPPPTNPTNQTFQSQPPASPTETSPAGIDAHQRRTAQLRREAIRRALNR